MHEQTGARVNSQMLVAWTPVDRHLGITASVTYQTLGKTRERLIKRTGGSNIWYTKISIFFNFKFIFTFVRLGALGGFQL
jgi:hypothetical protein